MAPTSFARHTLENTSKTKYLIEVTDWSDPIEAKVASVRIASWMEAVEEAALRRIERSAAEDVRIRARGIVNAIPVPLPRVAE